MGRRKKRHLRIRYKSQTVFSALAIVLVGLSITIVLSYLQEGTGLEAVRSMGEEYLGWGLLAMPLVFVGAALFLLRIKSPLTKLHIVLGFLLSLLCLVTLTQSGVIGFTIWSNFALLLSDMGAFIVVSAMFFIGLTVLFNTSIDEVAKQLFILYKQIAQLSAPLFRKWEKPVFVEKLPIKPPPIDTRRDQNKTAAPQSTKLKNTTTPSAVTTTLGTSVITNVPSTNRVWEYPPLSLLSSSGGQKADRGDMKRNASVIEKTLESFGVTARVVEVNLGPAVTQYALEIAIGTKLSKLTSLANDLALALAAPTGQIRIEAPIPGRSLVGIEIPNRSLEFVTLSHMLSTDMSKNKNKLLVALGLDVSGNPITANIAKMPHVLIAGTTGSGKSVLINSWIASLLFRTTPDEVRLILVDPKRVELTGFNGIPHLLTPVIVEPDKILSALKWSMQEMDRRYKLFAEVGVRHIDGYNELSGFQAIPYIVIFIDELADLMAYAPVEVEDSICRIAQMARATGIHLVLATQRPSVDVITGLIKANVPSRIAFNVSSMIDSRVIIDMPGAEKLLGRGDMLYIPPDQAKPSRIQGTFVSEQEVSKLVEFLKSKNAAVQYTQEVTAIAVSVKKSGNGMQMSEDGKDPLFEQAVRVVCQYDRASASLLQRRLSVGYARAARIIDQLENFGVIGPGEGAKPRDVLVRNPDEFFANQDTASNN